MMVTGSYNRVNGHFKMHSPTFPYQSTVYIGYSLDGMKRKYRQDFNLKYKRIDWIILGMGD